MASWREFRQEAPTVAETFLRRHAATGKLCLLATLRSDGYPRISPIEPRIFEDHLVLVGMPGTTKFRDLGRDPRFNLHTATIDAYVGDGDAKLWGLVHNLPDPDCTPGSPRICSPSPGWTCGIRPSTPSSSPTYRRLVDRVRRQRAGDHDLAAG